MWVPWLKPCDDLFFPPPKIWERSPNLETSAKKSPAFLGLGLCEKVTRSKSMAKSKGSSNSWDKKRSRIESPRIKCSFKFFKQFPGNVKKNLRRPMNVFFHAGGSGGGGGWELVENSMGNSTPS